MSRIARLALGVVAAIAWTTHAQAREHAWRFFGEDDGVPTPVLRLAQDTSGYLWFGTQDGLVRFDGRAMARIHPDVADGEVRRIVPIDDAIVAVVRDTVWRIAGDVVEPVTSPNGAPFSSARDGRATSAGLWILDRDGLWLRDDEHGWTAPLDHAIGDTTISGLPGAWADVLYVATAERLLEVRGTEVVREHAVGTARFVVPHAGGIVVHTAEAGEVFRIEGQVIARWETFGHGQGHGLAVRDGELWVANGAGIARTRDGRVLEAIPGAEGFTSPRDVIVDHEGGLWVATADGALHLPEPRSFALSIDDGLPGGDVRSVAIAGATDPWVTTQSGGLARVRDGSVSAIAEHRARGELCRDGAGTVWTIGEDAVLAVNDTEVRAWPRPGAGSGACTVDEDGTAWLTDARGIIDTVAFSDVPNASWQAPEGSDGGLALRDAQALVLVSRGRVCRAPLPERPPRHDADPLAWQCRAIDGLGRPLAAVRVSSGGWWIATDGGTVLRGSGDRWEPITASVELDAAPVRGLASAREGIWVLGDGLAMRVVETADNAGWRVVERLGARHGLPFVGGTDLAETHDGALWIAGAAGLVHVPSDARASQPTPPRRGFVVLAGHAAVAADGSFEIAPATQIHLELGVLSFRDPSATRHRLQIDDGTWSEVATDARIQLGDLAPGRHTITLATSLDGAHWAAAPALVLDVRPPWWRSTVPWLLVGIATALGVGGWWIGRAPLPIGLSVGTVPAAEHTTT